MNKNKSLFNCYIKSKHYKNFSCRIYSDKTSTLILNDQENIALSQNNYDYESNVLIGSIINEKYLINSVILGCNSYLIYRGGYDTSMIKLKNKLKNVNLYEIDNKEVISDKINRFKSNNIDISYINYIECDFKRNKLENVLSKINFNNNPSYNNLIGLSYY